MPKMQKGTNRKTQGREISTGIKAAAIVLRTIKKNDQKIFGYDCVAKEGKVAAFE